MPLQTNDALLISRLGFDYKVRYATLLKYLNIDLEAPSSSEVIDIINNILAGKNPDGSPGSGDKYLQSGDNVTELVNDAGYIKASEIPNTAGDGEIAFSGLGGITIGGDASANADQDSKTTTEISVDLATDSGLKINASDQLEVDANWLNTNSPAPNDKNINLVGGDGISVTGSTPTTNQSNDSTTNISLDPSTIDGIEIDGGKLVVKPTAMVLNDLTDVDTIPVENYILTWKTDGTTPTSGKWVAEYNPIADTPVEFQSTIDVSVDEAPNAADISLNNSGDLYVQSHSAGQDPTKPVTAKASWTGIIGEEVYEGQYVLWGSDDQWHLGRRNDSISTLVQSDYGENDVNESSYIKNKPDIQGMIDGSISAGVKDGKLTITYGGVAKEFTANQDSSSPVSVTIPKVNDTLITIGAGNGIVKTGTDASTNQSTTNTASLAVKAKKDGGIIVDANGVYIDTSFNLPTVKDGKLIVKKPKVGVAAGEALFEFSANQSGNTTPQFLYCRNQYIQNLEPLP